MPTEQEFTDYVGSHWQRLVRSAVLLGCRPAEAEDVVQSALTRCLVGWSKVRRADDRDAYVHRILINTFVSSRRRRWVREQPTATLPETLGTDDAEAIDLADAVTRSLAKLPADQRMVVVLRYYAHLDERQMAEAMGVARGTVKSRLSRALKVLADDPSLNELRGSR